ncbi:MAG: hypothetical protein H6765_11095 [Candidatus Peribacteria bacterium]|nr:MAG: hypothetical protein H6765_11095 [Candidatus Peribacteria bacterium]
MPHIIANNQQIKFIDDFTDQHTANRLIKKLLDHAFYDFYINYVGHPLVLTQYNLDDPEDLDQVEVIFERDEPNQSRIRMYKHVRPLLI